MTRLALLLAALAGALGLSLAAADEPTKRAEAPGPGLAVATFAAGCFWCVEPPYDKTEGVVSTTSGRFDSEISAATSALDGASSSRPARERPRPTDCAT